MCWAQLAPSFTSDLPGPPVPPACKKNSQKTYVWVTRLGECWLSLGFYRHRVAYFSRSSVTPKFSWLSKALTSLTHSLLCALLWHATIITPFSSTPRHCHYSIFSRQSNSWCLVSWRMWTVKEKEAWANELSLRVWSHQCLVWQQVNEQVSVLIIHWLPLDRLQLPNLVVHCG